jgi:hypothetical protein
MVNIQAVTVMELTGMTLLDFILMSLTYASSVSDQLAASTLTFMEHFAIRKNAMRSSD